MAFEVSKHDRYFADEFIPLSFTLIEACRGLFLLCLEALNAILPHQSNTTPSKLGVTK